MDPIYSYALKTTITEIKSVSPEVSNAFIFKKDGEIIAQDDNITEETIKKAIDLFNEMSESTDVFGRLENITIQCSNGQVTFTPCKNDFYLATVSSRETDEKIFYALTRVLVPTIIKLISQLTDSSDSQLIFLEKPKKKTPKTKPVEQEQEVQPSQPAENKPLEPEPEKPPENPEPLIEPTLPKAPVNQLMVDKVNGLMVASDTVRIDCGIVASWNETYENKTIRKVKIETLKMKKIECKVKPLKDNSIKGIIQIPEKLLQALELSKGELVMVNPVIEN